MLHGALPPHPAGPGADSLGGGLRRGAGGGLRRDGTHQVEIALPALGRRRIKVSGQEISRSGELMGHVTGVLFSPEDLRTVKDGPAERRRFVDMALSQIKPAYYYGL